MSLMVVLLAIALAAFAYATVWQRRLFESQLDKVQKVAEDGIDALGDSLKKARERIAELEEDYRYVAGIANKLDCDLQEKFTEVKELAEQKLALEKALSVSLEEINKLAQDQKLVKQCCCYVGEMKSIVDGMRDLLKEVE